MNPKKRTSRGMIACIVLAIVVVLAATVYAVVHSVQRAIAVTGYTTHMQLGQAAMRNADYGTAENEFRAMTTLFPNAPEAYYLLGTAHTAQGRYPTADADYRKSLELAHKPHWKQYGHLGLGRNLAAQGKWREAVAEYDAAAAADAPDAELLAARATARLQLNDYPRALDDLNRCIAREPSANSYDLRARVYEHLRRYGEAVADGKKALQLSPEDPVILSNLGWTEYEAGDIASAIRHTRTAIDINPRLTYAQLNLGLYYAVREDWKNAQAAYKAGLAGATDEDAKAGLGDVREALKRKPTSPSLRKAEALLRSQAD